VPRPEGVGSTSPLPHPRRVTRWDVWSLPSRLLGSVLLIELLAASLFAVDIATTPLSAYSSAVGTVSTLVIGGIVHAEISLRVERIRRRVVHQSAHIDLSSVWTFAGVLLLPPAIASLAVIVLYLYLYVRVWRPAKAPAYRQAFSTATVILAVHAAAGAAAHTGLWTGDPLRADLGPLTVIVGLLAYTVVNTCLVVGVVVVSANKSVREVLGHGDEVVLEVATLSLGALVALAMSASGPALVVFVLPPLLVLHRAVLVRQLEQAANTDSKTGLLTAAAWHQQATQHLQRAQRNGASAAVLILDLDHFKRVNDDHGHLAGDLVLRAMGSTLREEVRDHDLVGRFGGEEFVMLLPGPQGACYEYAEVRRIAERIRRSVTRLGVEIPTPDGPLTITGLSVSIGGATFPEDGGQIRDLVSVADTALYAAKRDGRNTVRLGQHRTPTVPLQVAAQPRTESTEPPAAS
jgi:diguanylate cyclase (GGDEF)-like protein